MRLGRFRFDPVAALCMAAGAVLLTAATGPTEVGRGLVIYLALILASIHATYVGEDKP